VARTAGGPYVYGSNGDPQEYARVEGTRRKQGTHQCSARRRPRSWRQKARLRSRSADNTLEVLSCRNALGSLVTHAHARTQSLAHTHAHTHTQGQAHAHKHVQTHVIFCNVCIHATCGVHSLSRCGAFSRPNPLFPPHSRKITWCLVMTKKMRGHSGKKLHKNREIVVY